MDAVSVWQESSSGQRELASLEAAAEWPDSAWRLAMAHPVLRRLSGWVWEHWYVPGVAGTTWSLVGCARIGASLATIFIESDAVARVWWESLDGAVPARTLQGSVAALVPEILDSLQHERAAASDVDVPRWDSVGRSQW